MQKRAPTLANLVVILLFVLSCFGLLLFLWSSFGGPLPLKPKGYRFSVAFPRTLALSEQSDVRISGVSVGHVVALKLGNDGRTHATIELNGKYAPIHSDMHAILRQKTLLGETYVQLIPEGNHGPNLADEGELPVANVEPSVTLDDILSTFDPKTRRAFQVWQQSLAAGIDEKGESINAGIAELEPFSENGAKLVALLDSQEGAVRKLVHYTGVVFNALASRDHQLEGLITNGGRTFHATAEASQQLAETFKALPTFERTSRIALKELDAFSKVANPYLTEFRKPEVQLSALLTAAKPFAPEFNRFLTSVGPLTKAARTGLPDVKKTLDLTTPVLESLRPVLHNLDPFLQYTGEYVPEVQAFFANLTAATESHGNNTSAGKGPAEHLLTAMNVLGPESLALYPSRQGVDRANPYLHPGAFGALASGLPVFSASTCANSAPSVAGPANETVSESILEQIVQFKVANKPESSGNEVAAPACTQQGPFTFNGKTSQFPEVTYSGK